MPCYRIRFMNEFARNHRLLRVCQRTIVIRSAESPDEAIEAAKSRFAGLEGIRDWRIHASMIEIEPLERAGLAHESHVLGLVTERYLLEACLPRRPTLKPGAIDRISHGDHGADSLRTFGVGAAREMSGIRVIGHQSGLQHR